MGRNEKFQQKQQKRKIAGWTVHMMNSARSMNSARRNFLQLHFSSHFALLSFWDLICNDEFNSGSSCLN